MRWVARDVMTARGNRREQQHSTAQRSTPEGTIQKHDEVMTERLRGDGGIIINR